MRVATYSRVSTHDKGQNPEVQRDEMRRFCAARGWPEIKVELIDEGYSGGTDKRPGLAQLLKLARSRQIDCIVVLKLDRLFRSLKHMVLQLEEFEQLGITFVAVRDAVDWSTSTGRFFVQILSALAELERGITRERVLLGLEHARRKGKTLGRPKKRDDDAIRTLRSQGFSYSEIESKLGVSKSAVYRCFKGVAKTPFKNAGNPAL